MLVSHLQTFPRFGQYLALLLTALLRGDVMMLAHIDEVTLKRQPFTFSSSFEEERTDTHTQTHRQTDRQTGRQTGRQVDRQTGRQADRQTDICIGR